MSFFPSYSVVKETRIAAPTNLPTQVPAGSPLLLPMELNFESLSLSGETFVPLSAQSKWFGIVGLYSPPSLSLSGFQKNRVSPYRFWEPAEVKYFVHPIKVTQQSLRNANPLRIPASVWDDLMKQTEELKFKEKQLAKDIFSNPLEDWNFSCPKIPVSNIVTSRFGSARTLPSGRSYFHSGVDLRAAVGVPIRAASRGFVRFAGPMTVPGNNVILDHGQGLFSRYMHLSEIKVQPGNWVEAGEVVGLAGSTGRVEAPHLHWEMIWKGHYADPLALLETLEPLCDQG